MAVTRNELVQYVAAMVAKILLKHHVENTTAEGVGQSIADLITDKFGGQVFTIPNWERHGKQLINDYGYVGDFRRPYKRRGELLNFLDNNLVTLIDGLGKPCLDAKAIAHEVISSFLLNFSGQTFTLPKDRAFKIYQRDKRLLKEYNGLNMGYLSEKYNLSQNAIYRILKKY